MLKKEDIEEATKWLGGLDRIHETLAELAHVVEGKPDFAGISEINLNDLANKFRMQRIIFETARDIYDQIKPTWKGKREFLLAQLIQLVEEFILSEKIRIFPQFFDQDDKKRRILITLNMNRVMHHIWKAIRFENTESITPVFNIDSPIRSTGDMRTSVDLAPGYGLFQKIRLMLRAFLQCSKSLFTGAFRTHLMI